ncbi:hypothetical protein Poli38472_000970 [Pythium oligandrum]|uniref:WRKY19-like zinc finger domain-containing protein n=1 Tax=Pythium oligandrum TaxID=41045 RepID=A0A8K1FJP5_PYTOL|nr:hypothetical protein Poli38472_000970 [Pythium oligandrum]|eukprot:TMW60928.1 hypothetical protein Poli38472_000970 [Pythium oligandrum]
MDTTIRATHVLEIGVDSRYVSPPATPLPHFQALLQAASWSPMLPQRLTALKWATLSPPGNAIALASHLMPKTEVLLPTPTKLTRRALWKCCRRPLSMQDLLCNSKDEEKPRVPRGNASHRRQCGVPHCLKYALSGGYCIGHGGGKPCRQEGCATVAQSGGLCKAHGGGSKCKTVGCMSVARRKGLCMMHGGRQPCNMEGCNKCAHGGGLCIAHGGGKRCATIGCTKSAQAGGFCYSHGGGKRCAAPQCFQAARKGGLCIRHRNAAAIAAATTGLAQDEGIVTRKVVSEEDVGEEEEEDGVCESGEQADSANVDELSELFSSIEENCDDSVDFSVLLEGEDALNVEDVRDIFSDLEDSVDEEQVAVFSEQEQVDAANVDEVSELFSCLEQDLDVQVAEPTAVDVVDAGNVDAISALFTELAEAEDVTAVEQHSADWIASLDVNDVSTLFSELEQAEQPVEAKPPTRVDPRIFVPSFSVRIEGRAAVAIPPPTRLVAGPPRLLAGPPVLGAPVHLGVRSREERIERWMDKRKARTQGARPKDEFVSQTRRACAAKRQRVNGRFISEKSAFVSITTLQQ